MLSITAYVYVLKGIPTTAMEKGIWVNTTEFCPVLFENYPLQKSLYQDGGSLGVVLCVIIGIFDVNIQRGESFRPALVNGLIFLGVLTSFMLFESARSGRPYPRGTVVVITSIAQLLTGAVTLPFFWMLFLWVEYKEEIPSPFSTVDAKTAVTATVLGYFVPTALFSAYPESIWLNTLWQIFPLLTLISAKLYRLIFAESPNNQNNQETLSGGKLIEKFYLLATISGTILHLITSRFSLAGAVAELITRPITDLDASKGDTFQTAASTFLQWDLLFIFVCAVLSVSWTRGTLMQSQAVKTLAWFALATPLIGPPAALSGFLYQREQRIERVRASKAS